MYSIVHLLLEEVVGYTWGLFLLVIADLLALLSVPSVLLRRRGQPLAAMSWLLALFVIPYFGVGWWWFIGRERVNRKRRLRRRSTEEFCACLSRCKVAPPSPAADHDFEPILPPGLLHGYGPLQVGGPSQTNHIDLLVDGGEAFPVIAQMIEQANDYIHLLFYIWSPDKTGHRLRDALIEKARQGVEVRVLIDAIGSPKFYRKLAAPLLEAGGKVGIFLPPRYLARRPTFNFRNHRKLIVVDGVQAFTGGMNVGEPYEHLMHDLAVLIRGPAVRDLHLIFLDDWFFATGENLATDRYLLWHNRQITDTPQPSQSYATCAIFAGGPDSEQNVLRDALFHMITMARQRLWMITPYFIPGADILAALRAAVQRGADVRLILPGQNDVAIVRYASRSYYKMLLESGVRLFEYQPRLLHAKALVLDTDYSMLGSANLDVRSFQINFELAGFIASKRLNSQLADVFEADLQQCREIDIDEVMTQTKLSVMGDSLAHLASPLL